MRFEKDETGNYIGYHVEGCETFIGAGAVPLTMDTLDDNRLLFVSNNPNSWVSKSERVIKITFKVNKEYPLFTNFRDQSPDSYINLHEFSDQDLEKGILSRHYVGKDSTLEKLVGEGYNLFMLDDPKEDLPEAYITNPKRWVVSMEDL